MKLGIRSKLFISFGIVVVMLLIVIGVLSLYFSTRTTEKLAMNNLNNVNEITYQSIKSQYVMSNELNTNIQKNNIEIAYDIVKSNIKIDNSKKMLLSVENQETKSIENIEVPQMLFGDSLIFRNNDVVDEIAKHTNSTVTIFQVSNVGMIRLATNVKKSDGTRAIGTYIPTTSPVFSAIINGNTYFGRAFVVTEWYVTAYKPILDNARNVIGVIYTGVKELNIQKIREDLLKIKLGRTGYFYVMDSKGNLIVYPSIEGKNLYETQDKNGYYFVKDIISKKEGKITYWWQNEGESRPREKLIVFKYLPETDWIICGGIYFDELYEDVNNFRNLFLLILLVSIVIISGIVILISNSIAGPINKNSKELSFASDNLESASYQVSSSSQELSSGSSELASSIEEITSSLEELQSVIESNTKNINQSEIMMRDTTEGAIKVTDKMSDLQIALSEINENSKKIVKIIKVIDDIAFQTNILALNAAVEAARAGDAGRGFAVVADQVKMLAQKSAEAAKETAELIEKAINSVIKGEDLGKTVNEIQIKSKDMTEKVAILMDEVNRSSKEQLKGINQITQAVNQVNSVVQQTASSAEESAAASEELLSQAESLNKIVDNISIVVKGKVVRYKSENNNRKSGKKPTLKITSNEDNNSNIHKLELVKPEDKIPLEDFSNF
ncbi:MAG TPA: Cache 3/Cache 2 fusion domain-containing protein [Spirochaetota bacterium]|nr:Cache 3/Cache 2 fusion domain-containing protein [Spirochaetota bacterium]